MSNNNSIGSFLAALRKANGLTQKQLAEKLNVSDKAVSRWERDECSPDLSLIPVLAELYGVTSDEILRGRRADPGAEPTPKAEEKSQKRLQHLLDQTATSYRVRSMLTCWFAALGILAAMICNLGFNRAYLGFLIGCICFVGAATLQTVFRIQHYAALGNEEFDETAVQNCKNTLLCQSEKVYSLIVVLFAFTLPLTMVGDAYWGLTLESWLQYGLVYAAVAAVACLIVCHIVNLKLGVARKKEWSPVGRLRLRFAAIGLVVLALTGFFHFLVADHLGWNPQLYSPGTKFETFEDFREFIETPLTEDGEQLTLNQISPHGDYLYQDADGDYYDAYVVNITYQGIEHQYRFANKTVTYMSCDDSGIYTYTTRQYSAAADKFLTINLCIAPVYPIEVLALALIYRRKKVKLISRGM